ncbi:breast carcinoma-amplified sequence 1 isoform X13 [Sebastes umbrosus]|uniref:breast carcinoma-amplified sequence 1 isoform X13 n=1 Tax=Sebastes umbrosus TaxID=72105 RepID=UPI00189F7C72|nr:breast carcinoma-amplified sequence 1 isoform X13 [Sebastes umbrosus]
MGNDNSKNKELNKNTKSCKKHGNGLSANVTSNGLEVTGNGDTIVQQNGEPLSLNHALESTEYMIVESDCKPADAPVISESHEPINPKEEVTESNEDQTDVSLPATDPKPETANLKQETKSLTSPESVTLDPGPEEEKAPETDNGNGEPVENQEDGNPEENPVMNFFKTLVTTKVTKKETATPDATKVQSQKENQPAATTTVAQVSEPPAAPKGMSIPPPPPPEPPKMEIKGEPAAKPVKPTPKEEPKAAAKEPESSKGKSAKDTLSKFFRSKVQLGGKASKGKGASASGAKAPSKTAAVKVDPSKASTLEAAAKPEPPPPVQEEKKTASKSAFFSLFKPKAADPKKATPAPAAAAAETVKAKEEPKAAAKSSEAVVDNKPASVASQAGDDAANMPKKLEKRNSIQLFFKILGQKRNSTDAGVQTEPAVAAPAAEKAK